MLCKKREYSFHFSSYLQGCWGWLAKSYHRKKLNYVLQKQEIYTKKKKLYFWRSLGIRNCQLTSNS